MRLNGNPQLTAKKTTKSVRECVKVGTNRSTKNQRLKSPVQSDYIHYMDACYNNVCACGVCGPLTKRPALQLWGDIPTGYRARGTEASQRLGRNPYHYKNACRENTIK